MINIGKKHTEEKLNPDKQEKYLFEEIKIIQDIIKRMAGNSFLIKGWTLTLVVGALLLKGSMYQALIAFIPAILFWFLDAYFLRQERLYRKLYEWVVNNRLKTSDYIFDMNAYRFDNKVPNIFRIMTSITLLIFYISIIISIIVFFVLSINIIK